MSDWGGGDRGLFGHNTHRLAECIPPLDASPQDWPDAVTSAWPSQPASPPATSGSRSGRPAVGHLDNGSFWN